LKEDERNTGKKTVPKLKPSEIEQALPRWTHSSPKLPSWTAKHVRRWAQARTVVITQRCWERNTPQSMRHTNDRIAAPTCNDPTASPLTRGTQTDAAMRVAPMRNLPTVVGECGQV
jgi:hypothetical protein